ncbi:hypothetical protein ACFL6S_07970 [Candidatus Poribacteria bacterium]
MLKIGIIGAGTMGGVYADYYSEIPDAKVVAVADYRRGRITGAGSGDSSV